MKKVCVCGHFGLGLNLLNGQTIKTKIVTDTLKKELGEENIIIVDTHGGLKALPSMLFNLLKSFIICDSIIMLPAHNGIKVFVPVFVIYNFFFHRRLHYVVIGGWLSSFIDEHRLIQSMLKYFHGIYVETNIMRKSLEEKGFNNIFVMPNFKSLNILKPEELIYNHSEPYKLCTFSRVMKEKGIEDAVEAVVKINKKFGRVVYTLDIYGQIERDQEQWFEQLKTNFPDYVRYCGVVDFDKSVDTIKNYFALLFPTYYSGEGFAGTLLDAMAAGVPVVASDWKHNKEIIINGKTGILFPARSLIHLSYAILNLSNNIDHWEKIKLNCVRVALKYIPKEAIKVLVTNLVRK